ncbi:MAG: hypothetical protein KBC44_00610 [Candidatus Pacebacteria bacterium]|nr:hypothetical protein [Candidatus Paceibacterota bacterium]
MNILNFATLLGFKQLFKLEKRMPPLTGSKHSAFYYLIIVDMIEFFENIFSKQNIPLLKVPLKEYFPYDQRFRKFKSKSQNKKEEIIHSLIKLTEEEVPVYVILPRNQETKEFIDFLRSIELKVESNIKSVFSFGEFEKELIEVSKMDKRKFRSWRISF